MSKRLLKDAEVAQMLTARGNPTTARSVQEWRLKNLNIYGFELVPVGHKFRWVECFDVAADE